MYEVTDDATSSWAPQTYTPETPSPAYEVPAVVTEAPTGNPTTVNATEVVVAVHTTEQRNHPEPELVIVDETYPAPPIDVAVTADKSNFAANLPFAISWIATFEYSADLM